MKKAIIYNIFTNGVNPLNELLDEKLDALTSLDLVELVEKLENEFKNIEKVRLKLLKDIFGIDEKTGKVLDVENPEKLAKFNKEFNTILQKETDIEKIEVKITGLKISPKNLILLKNIIKFTK